MSESTLTPAQRRRLARQKQAAQLKAASGWPTDQQVADAVGICRRTIERWRHDAAFVAMCEDADKAAWASREIEERASTEAFIESIQKAKEAKRQQAEQRRKELRRRRYLRYGV